MVQQWRRSYFYFISFAKKKGIAFAPRKGSVFARARKVFTPLGPRPDWDNTIHDLSSWKLSPRELEAKRIAYKTLPEHRVRRSVSSAIPSLSCNYGSEQCSGPRGSTTSTTIDERGATVEEELKRVSQPKQIKNSQSVRRFGKENKKSAALHQTHRQSSNRECKKLLGSVLKTKATQSIRKSSKPTDALSSRDAQSGGGNQPFRSHHTIAEVTETELGENHRLRASPTVDFEEEVKQFEGRTKFLVQAVKTPLDSRLLPVSRRANSKKQSLTPAKILHCRNLSRKEGVMDKSESSDDDSSLSGPWGSSITRYQKVMHPVPERHQYRKLYSRRVEEEATAATTTGAHPPSKKFNQWVSSKTQNELIYFKQPVDPAIIKPRTKLAKRHFGSIQRTSTIGDWKVNYEEGATDHLSLQQDFQRHMLRCQHDLAKELKEFKVSISKQIMNLQLDIDTVLELQQRKHSHPAEIRATSSYSTGRESPATKGVDESIGLPTYSSMKVKKDVMIQTSPSSGESSHKALFSCYDGSPYASSRKSTRSVLTSEERRRQSSAAAAPEPHVFDNPIYHVQTSSEEGESSDSGASISSVELARFLASRGDDQHLKSVPHVNGGDYKLPNEASLENQGRTSSNGLRTLGIEDQKNKSLVPCGLPRNQRVEAARFTESDNLENSYRKNRIESNGLAQSNIKRVGNSSEQSLRPMAPHYQTEVSRPVSKCATPPSPGIGTYRTQPLGVAEEDPVDLHDLELRLGHLGVNSAVNSGRTSPRDYRSRLSPSVSRPLFTTGNSSNVSNSSIIPMNVRDGHHTQDRERSDARHEQPSSRNSQLVKNADEREVFTLRGWSAAFLQPAETFQKGISLGQTVVPPAEPPSRNKTPDPTPKEIPTETGNGNMRFQRRCAKGGVAWTVSEPPGSAKKLRNNPVL